MQSWVMRSKVHLSIPTSDMMRILFVCHGNICRSPMSEFIMKDMVQKRGLSDRVYVESCATSCEELGNPVYPPARRELESRGVKCEHRGARRMTVADYDRFDKIVAMDEQNLRNMRNFVGSDPENKVSLMMEWSGEHRGVADPWYTGDFAKTFDDISIACNDMLGQIL